MINRLNEFRKRIDDLDLEIIYLLEKRIDITKEIITFKKENNIQIEDNRREGEITDHLSSIVSEENKTFLTKEIIENIWKNIFNMIKKEQNKNPYKCPACGRGLAYVNAPCVNPDCSEKLEL